MPGWTERYLLLATLYCKCQNRSISIIFRMRQSTSIKIIFWWRNKLTNMFLSRFWINTNLFLFNCELSHTKYVCSIFFFCFFSKCYTIWHLHDFNRSIRTEETSDWKSKRVGLSLCILWKIKSIGRPLSFVFIFCANSVNFSAGVSEILHCGQGYSVPQYGVFRKE